jgi:hypothetical protein
MTSRQLCIALVFATIAAIGSAVAPSLSAPAAPQAASATETPKAETARKRLADDPCRQVVWPYVPPECMRNADERRAARPVRIVPLPVAGQAN